MVGVLSERSLLVSGNANSISVRARAVIVIVALAVLGVFWAFRGWTYGLQLTRQEHKSRTIFDQWGI